MNNCHQVIDITSIQIRGRWMSGLFNAIRELSGNRSQYQYSAGLYLAFVKRDLNQAAVLSQLVFWSGRTTRTDGWLYKRHEHIGDELASLSSSSLALKKLKTA